MACKGIVLAGGTGTRLYPLTLSVSKQLMPVYNKPLIYYPLSVLMLADIKDILVISTPTDRALFERLLGDGTRFGMRLSYATQAEPRGIAEALIIGADFIGKDNIALILGDNIFHGEALEQRIAAAAKKTGRATIFSYRVSRPERFGVVDLDDQGRPRAIVEKPASPPSDKAVTGLYIYPPDVVGVARALKPSARDELEITDVNQSYLARQRLDVEFLGKGYMWLDTGTHNDLLDAANYVATLERRQGQMIGCMEEVAWRKGWIGDGELARLAEPIRERAYGQYLLNLLAQKH
jgi:glucose-1-phosphate thymidylyltransferase